MYNFVINTPKKVKAKFEMLESLKDIQITNKIMSNKNNSKKDNVLD